MTSRQELADGGPPKHAVARSAARRRPRRCMERRGAQRPCRHKDGPCSARAWISLGATRRFIPLGWGNKGITGEPGARTNNTGGEAMVAVIPAKRAMRARAGIQYAAVPR